MANGPSASSEGTVQAILGDTGESLMLMHELDYTGGESDAAILTWLLQASDWNSSRLGLALHSTGVVHRPSWCPRSRSSRSGSAWGLAAVL